jgi:hypothetical protein
MCVLDTVSSVSPSEVFDRRDEPIEAGQPLDRGAEHLHQHPALFCHIAPEQLLECGVERKQPAIEQGRRIVGDRGDHRERGLNEVDLP